MPGNRYIGAWEEPVSERVGLPFNAASLIELLRAGLSPDSMPYSHQDVAHWCERFVEQYRDCEPPSDIKRLLPVVSDIEVQWDLFLSNTYTLQQLQRLDFTAVRLPKEWFREWLRRAEG